MQTAIIRVVMLGRKDTGAGRRDRGPPAVRCLLLALSVTAGLAAQDPELDGERLVRRLVATADPTEVLVEIEAAGPVIVPALLGRAAAESRAGRGSEPAAMRLWRALDRLAAHLGPSLDTLLDFLDAAPDADGYAAVARVVGSAVSGVDATTAQHVAERASDRALLAVHASATQVEWDRALAAHRRLRYRCEANASAPLERLIHTIEVEHDADAKEAAIAACAARGPAARAALPALAGRLAAPTSRLRAPGARTDVRPDAARAILRIAATDAEALPAHVWFVEHGDAADAARALDGIRSAGSRAVDAVPALVRVVESAPDTVRRREAVVTLGAIGPAAADAIPTLESLAGDDDSALARIAAAALVRIGVR